MALHVARVPDKDKYLQTLFDSSIDGGHILCARPLFLCPIYPLSLTLSLYSSVDDLSLYSSQFVDFNKNCHLVKLN